MSDRATAEVPAALVARCAFPAEGTAVRCGVSGGADSVSLMVLAVAAGLEVTAVHVDHGLRPTSASDADHVARLAGRFGAEFVAERVEIDDGPDLERRARDARRTVLGADALLGHTADDVAETMLLALIRGTGPAGIVSMDRRTRPIVSLRRHETQGLCAALGVDVVDDETNTSPRFRRNRVRHELLPLLDDIAERDVVPLLCRFAELQIDAVAGLDARAEQIDGGDLAVLRATDRGVATTALRRWWRAGTGSPYAPDAAAMERIMAVAAGHTVATEVSGGWRVSRGSGRLVLAPVSAPDPADTTDGAGIVDTGAAASDGDG